MDWGREWKPRLQQLFQALLFISYLKGAEILIESKSSYSNYRDA
jgi:hypothetical protein